MILVYLKRRKLSRQELLRASPPADIRVVRVWDSPRQREELVRDPEVLGAWGSYALLDVPTQLHELDDADVIFDRR